MDEDSVAYELSRDPKFQRAIVGPYNYAMFFCRMHGLDGDNIVVVDSVLKRAIELWSEAVANEWIK